MSNHTRRQERAETENFNTPDQVVLHSGGPTPLRANKKFTQQAATVRTSQVGKRHSSQNSGGFVPTEMSSARPSGGSIIPG